MENAEQTKLTGVTPVTTALGNLPLPCSSQDSSEVDSVSPEPLSEVLMPPPATPRSNSAGKSPHISAQQTDGSLAATKSKKEPATPASLMRIQRQKSRAVAKQQSGSNLGEGASMAETGTEQILDDIALPGPAKASSRPVLSPIDTSNANDSEATPTLSARKTPKTTASAPLTATGFQFQALRLGMLRPLVAPSYQASALIHRDHRVGTAKSGTATLLPRSALQFGQEYLQASSLCYPMEVSRSHPGTEQTH